MKPRWQPPSLRMRARGTRIPRVVLIGCITAIAPWHASAGISDEEFNALKNLVIRQGQRLEELEKARTRDQVILDEDRKRHEQDQREIEQLKQQLEQTRKTATDAAASQVQPIHPVPDGSSATHNFMVVGDAEIQFGKSQNSHAAFELADFAPIFLFRARDNILFETGFDVNLQNGSVNGHDSGSSTSLNLSFAQLDYLLNDYVTVVSGDMLLPLGTYSERAAGWLNKIPDDPFPRDLLPGSGIGLQLRGAVPLGSAGQSLTYSAFAVNGPGSSDGTANHDQLDLGGNVGIKSDGTRGSLHATPSGGGRVGWFYPWKAHYDFELGLSGQTGTWNDADNRLWSAGVVDAALHIGPYFEAKGEYIRTWQQTDDAGTIRPRGWWAQTSYKLAGLNLNAPVINNLELVGRYDTSRDNAATRLERFTVGYVYYFTNTLLFEGDYEFINSNDPAQDHDRFVFQLSFGF
ncbi:MAG TPA: hypothetical protein VKY92_23140 [Verrucomicrobiae bacterium]|nr:hypothetical protein [Verrucomicrobiae bacterium]